MVRGREFLCLPLVNCETVDFEKKKDIMSSPFERVDITYFRLLGYWEVWMPSPSRIPSTMLLHFISLYHKCLNSVFVYYIDHSKNCAVSMSRG